MAKATVVRRDESAVAQASTCIYVILHTCECVFIWAGNVGILEKYIFSHVCICMCLFIFIFVHKLGMNV